MRSWLSSVAKEIGIVFQMTFVEPLLKGRLNDGGWLKDRHLRNGFLIAAPLFLAGTFFAVFVARHEPVLQFFVLFGVAVGTNLLWLSYAAWSRRRTVR